MSRHSCLNYVIHLSHRIGDANKTVARSQVAARHPTGLTHAVASGRNICAWDVVLVLDLENISAVVLKDKESNPHVLTDLQITFCLWITMRPYQSRLTTHDVTTLVLVVVLVVV